MANINLIYINLQYEAKWLTLQTNPESIQKDIPSESNTVDIEGLGEISVPQTPGLATIEIKSFFWQAKDLVSVDLYVNWLLQWQKSKKPAKLIITQLGYSMEVTCEHFSYEKRAGEEDDVYYELSLKEYRTYGAVYKNKVYNKSLMDTLSTISAIAGELTPILIPIPKPTRSSNKPKLPVTYTVTAADTLMSVTKKYTGDTEDWQTLYDLNKKSISNAMGGSGKLTKGMKLTIPEAWQ